MPRYFIVLLLFLASTLTQAQYPTRFETSGGAQTPTYEEGIAYYQKLAKDFLTIQM